MAASVYQVEAFQLEDVEVKDTYCQNAYDQESAYLTSLKPERLLAGFYEVAGLKPEAVRYSGWEQTEIQGHTLGHYLSAISQAYATKSSAELKQRIEKICEGLAVCQREDGFLFASPEEIFDRVEQQKPAWVPWYTTHKILQGLIHAYILAGSKTAYKVMNHLGEWIYQRSSKWDETTRKTVVSVEYGGLNDSLYQLYMLTLNPHFLESAHLFEQAELVEALYQNQDPLKGLHANTTIPKIIGFLNRYVVEKDPYYLKAAEHFWEIVVVHHTYCTGGNSEWEHFGEPDILDRERTACNCETCNTYNMLKLTKMLFEITKEKKYADFYEKTWINAILASQHPKTGMTTYFQPMGTGYFKVFGTPYDRFWCCTGTGMENFTKLGDALYFHDEKAIYINRYLSSELRWQAKKVNLKMTADFPNLETIKLEINQPQDQEMKVYFRIPDWCMKQPKVSEQDQEMAYTVEQGYGEILLRGHEKLTINFDQEVRYERLPDHPSTVAFMYGPIVLCGGLGKEKMELDTTGVEVLVPTKKMRIKEYLAVKDQSVDQWLAELSSHLIKREDQMVFELRGTDEDQKLYFKPYYSEYQERYGIYWNLVEQDSKAQKALEEALERHQTLLEETIDCIPVGNDQYELAHGIKGENTDTSGTDGHRCRMIKGKGYFRYEMTQSEPAAYLNVQYLGKEPSSAFEIWINGKCLVHEKLEPCEAAFYTKQYPLPEGISKKIEVKFVTLDESGYCKIFDELYLSASKEK